MHEWAMVGLGLQAPEFKNSRNDGSCSNTGDIVQFGLAVCGRKMVVTRLLFAWKRERVLCSEM